MQSNGSLQESSRGEYESHRIIHVHRTFQSASLYMLRFRKISGCDKPPRCSCASRLDLAILKTTQTICKIYYQSFRAEESGELGGRMRQAGAGERRGGSPGGCR